VIRRTDHATPLYPLKLVLTSPTSGGRSVGIVRSRTKATELVIHYTKCNIISVEAVYPLDTKNKCTLSLELERTLFFSEESELTSVTFLYSISLKLILNSAIYVEQTNEQIESVL
jgi:hypothetical protein